MFATAHVAWKYVKIPLTTQVPIPTLILPLKGRKIYKPLPLQGGDGEGDGPKYVGKLKCDKGEVVKIPEEVNHERI